MAASPAQVGQKRAYFASYPRSAKPSFTRTTLFLPLNSVILVSKLLLLLALGLLASPTHGQGRHKKFFEVATHGKYQPGAYTLADGSRHAGPLRIWQEIGRTVVQVDDYPALCQRIRASLEGPDDFKRIIYAYAFRQNISEISFERAATIFP